MRKTVLGGTKSLIVAPPRRVLVSFGELLTGHCQLRPKPATSRALYARVATKTIRAVTSPLEHLKLLMEGKSPGD